MVYNVDDIKRDVRITLDQNNNSTTLSALGDIDTLTLEQIIESKIEEAAQIVEATAPNSLLDNGISFASQPVTWYADTPGYGSGYLVLPSDFLRLQSFKMTDWDYGVTSVVREGEPLYAQQYSRFPGIRGNIQRPVVTISNRPQGLVLEFFSCDGGSDVQIERAVYIPIPKIVTDAITGNRTIDISSRLRPATIYYIAYMVALTLNDTTFAGSLLDTCKQLMQTT